MVRKEGQPITPRKIVLEPNWEYKEDTGDWNKPMTINVTYGNVEAHITNVGKVVIGNWNESIEPDEWDEDVQSFFSLVAKRFENIAVEKGCIKDA
jgi:hypothetical protein